MYTYIYICIGSTVLWQVGPKIANITGTRTATLAICGFILNFAYGCWTMKGEAGAGVGVGLGSSSSSSWSWSSLSIITITTITIIVTIFLITISVNLGTINKFCQYFYYVIIVHLLDTHPEAGAPWHGSTVPRCFRRSTGPRCADSAWCSERWFRGGIGTKIGRFTNKNNMGISLFSFQYWWNLPI